MYQVQLSANMLIALVDIDQGYVERDSPRFDRRTLKALARRQLIDKPRVRSIKTQPALTLKGRAYLAMARFEYKTAEEALAA